VGTKATKGTKTKGVPSGQKQRPGKNREVGSVLEGGLSRPSRAEVPNDGRFFWVMGVSRLGRRGLI